MMPHRIVEITMRVRTIEAVLHVTPVALKQNVPAAMPETPEASTPLIQVYSGYKSDDLKVFDRFTSAPISSSPGYITNFIGVKTRTSFVRGIESLSGKITGIPVPDDGWHSEAVEWIGLIKCVNTARGSFTAMELGAGWGPWAVAGATAARKIGIETIHLCCVESDPGHFEFMLEHFVDNGLNPSDHKLVQGAVGPEAGTARWPKVADPAGDWGARPNASGSVAHADHLGRHFDEWLDVQVFGVGDLLRERPSWDLVHIDVQGWEFSVCNAAVDLLNERVRWLVVGTHDAKLHGDLIDLLFRNGWSLENEKPPRFEWRDGAGSLLSMTSHDGTQVWRNPRHHG